MGRGNTGGARTPSDGVDQWLDDETSQVQPRDPNIGRILGDRYQLVHLLGKGAASAVYSAVHMRSKEAVAVKVLRERWRGNEAQRTRFQREADAIRAVDHPHIVRLYDAGVELDGTAWQVHELLAGRNLAEVLKERRLEVHESLTMAFQLLSALDDVHRRGFVHRDIKPENIFITDQADGRLDIKLLDFGIVKHLEQEVGAWTTDENIMLGTPGFMAPEQVTGDAVSARTDVWSVGALLFSALAGRAPFVAPQLSRLLIAIAREPAPSLLMFRSDVPRNVAEVVARALRTHPEHRFASASDMLLAIGNCRESWV